jgi:glycosyltransferase 2 family protein
MRQLWHRIILVMIVAVVIFAGFSIYADVGKLGDRLSQFAPSAVAAALALAFGNYLIRFTRWELYLRVVGVRAPRAQSAMVFLAGFAMAITPGKLGELIKAVLLHEVSGAETTRVAPVVIAERATDLLALVILGVIGTAAYHVAKPMVIAAGVVTVGGIAVLSSRRAAHALIAFIGKIPKIGKIAPKLLDSYDHLGTLVKPQHLAWATVLGTAAWLCECLGFAIIVNAFPGAHVPVGLATLIYAVTTVAGALSFLPGGLLVTEGSMTLLLVASAQGLDKPAAVAATILTRLCTLWFAVLLGIGALLWIKRARPRAVDAIEG